MTMRVTGFTFSGGTKYSSNIIRASNVSLVCEKLFYAVKIDSFPIMNTNCP
jgi:hypothetical protein